MQILYILRWVLSIIWIFNGPGFEQLRTVIRIGHGIFAKRMRVVAFNAIHCVIISRIYWTRFEYFESISHSTFVLLIQNMSEFPMSWKILNDIMTEMCLKLRKDNVVKTCLRQTKRPNLFLCNFEWCRISD